MIKKKFFKTNDECEITFEYEGESTKKVALVTEANGWQPVPMSKRRKDGVFYTKMRFPKESRFQFRYLLNDQTWMNDSAADAYVPNEFGGDNGIVDTTPSKN